jgi:hypothetical protein
MGGVDMDQCRFRLTGEGRADRSTTPPARYGAGYYLRQAWRTLREDGPRALARQVRDELGRRRGHTSGAAASPPGTIGGTPFWTQQAHLAATNDVLENLDALMAKRAEIQARRQRSDREIFDTVPALSFDVCFDTEEYRQTQQRLVELFDMPELFGEVYDPEIPFAL